MESRMQKLSRLVSLRRHEGTQPHHEIHITPPKKAKEKTSQNREGTL